MQNKFQNKYRIPSARLQTWDYANDGAYFITICTKNRKHFFGKVRDGIMELSEAGKLANQFWEEIPNHFSFIELGNFVVMPNHVHGILIINNSPSPVETRFIASKNNIESNNIESNNEENFNIESNNENFNIESNNDGIFNIENFGETRLIASLREKIGGFAGDKNPMLNDSISKIIRWYKGRCSFEIRKIQTDFGWQTRFHDHIIRDSKSFESIQNYIEQNPLKWENDKFYK